MLSTERMSSMSKDQQLLPISILDELDPHSVGHDLLRYISLPQLLGQEAETLLYYMGKNLARTLDIKTLEDIYYIYDKLGWGRLELIKERRRSLTFSLMADTVVRRLKAPFHTDFRLEAGFLAEAIQIIYGSECECTEKVHKKIHQIQFKVVYTS